jgi:hypothetical protein
MAEYCVKTFLRRQRRVGRNTGKILNDILNAGKRKILKHYVLTNVEVDDTRA